MEIEKKQYKGSSIEKGMKPELEDLSFVDLCRVEKALQDNFEKGLMVESTFTGMSERIDLAKAGRVSQNGKLVPVHIIDKNGKHTVKWKNPEDAGNHKKVSQGHKVTYKGESHTVHKVKKDGYWTLVDGNGKKHDKSPLRLEVHKPGEMGDEKPKSEAPKRIAPNKRVTETKDMSLEQLEEKVGMFGKRDVPGFSAYQKSKALLDAFVKENNGKASPLLKKQYDTKFQMMSADRKTYIANLKKKVGEKPAQEAPKVKEPKKEMKSVDELNALNKKYGSYMNSEIPVADRDKISALAKKAVEDLGLKTPDGKPITVGTKFKVKETIHPEYPSQNQPYEGEVEYSVRGYGKEYSDSGFNTIQYRKSSKSRSQKDTVENFKKILDKHSEPKVEEPKKEEPKGDTAGELKSFLEKNKNHFASFLSPKSFSTSLNNDVLTIKPASGTFTIKVDTNNKTVETTGKPDFKRESTSYVEIMESVRKRSKIKRENITDLSKTKKEEPKKEDADSGKASQESFIDEFVSARVKENFKKKGMNVKKTLTSLANFMNDNVRNSTTNSDKVYTNFMRREGLARLRGGIQRDIHEFSRKYGDNLRNAKS